MKAVILAAGEGNRLKKYTKDLPKGMLEFAGKSLIERQISTLRAAGVEEIIVVRGFAGDKIGFLDVTYRVNEAFATTNMVVSLFCAEDKMPGGVIVSYADILYSAETITALIGSPFDITVTVDTEWKRYWMMRYGRCDFDTESLVLSGDRIVELGISDPPPSKIDARYVGLIKFSAKGVEQMRSVWHKYRGAYWDKAWQVSGKPLRNAYLTDMLQALIDEGFPVHALKRENGWIEFDTNDDYEKALEWKKNGSLDAILRID